MKIITKNFLEFYLYEKNGKHFVSRSNLKKVSYSFFDDNKNYELRSLPEIQIGLPVIFNIINPYSPNAIYYLQTPPVIQMIP